MNSKKLKSNKMERNQFNSGMKSQAVKNSFYNILTSIVNKIGAVIFTIIVARVLQPTLFGIYGLAIVTVGIFLIFADLGINSALIRYTAHGFKKSKEKAASYFQYLLKIKTTLIILLAVLITVLAKPISEIIFKKPDLFWPLIFCALFLICSAFLDFFTSVFFSLKRVKYVMLKEVIVQAGRIGFFVLLGIFLLKTFLVISTILAIAIAFFLALIFVLFVLNKKYSFLFAKTEEIEPKEKKALFSFIGIIALASIIGIFNGSIDTLLLGIFLKNTANIGFYRSALLITSSAAGIIALGNVFLPIFTQIKGKELSRTFEKLFNYCAILAFPIAFGIALISNSVINLIYGISYSPAAILLTITSFIIISSTLSAIYGILFYAKEKPIKPTVVLGIVTIINFILNFFLITSLVKKSEYLATIGAAIAVTISNFIYLIAISILAGKQYKLKFHKKVLLKVILSCLFMSAVLILVSILYFKEISVWNLILQILVGFTIYLVLMLLMKGIKKEDFELIKVLFRK